MSPGTTGAVASSRKVGARATASATSSDRSPATPSPAVPAAVRKNASASSPRCCPASSQAPRRPSRPVVPFRAAARRKSAAAPGRPSEPRDARNGFDAAFGGAVRPSASWASSSASPSTAHPASSGPACRTARRATPRATSNATSAGVRPTVPTATRGRASLPFSRPSQATRTPSSDREGTRRTVSGEAAEKGRAQPSRSRTSRTARSRAPSAASRTSCGTAAWNPATASPARTDLRSPTCANGERSSSDRRRAASRSVSSPARLECPGTTEPSASGSGSTRRGSPAPGAARSAPTASETATRPERRRLIGSEVRTSSRGRRRAARARPGRRPPPLRAGRPAPGSRRSA